MSEKPDRMRRLSLRLFAEFGVIVLGVLVALWADDWAASRTQRATEVARMQALSENVSETLIAIGAEMEIVEAAEGALRLLIAEDAPQRTSEEVRDAVVVGFFYGSDFTPELNVYEDLKNSGELALLSDASLRHALSDMDARLHKVELSQIDLMTVQQLQFDRYATEAMDLRAVLSNLELPGAGSTESVESFRNDTRFLNLVVLKLDLVSFLRQNVEGTQEALTRVQTEIGYQIEPE